jgi:hypothetical protein
MSLNLPTVTVTPGPTWANNVNTAFSVVDGHNHTSGSGVQIPSAGLNINADLSFAGNNATNLRSTRFSNTGGIISGANDLACLYSSGGDLYWNSGAGISIQLTIGGALNASSIGGIGGDYATSGATVSYSSLNQTFTFWQSSGVSALMDVGSIKLHPIGVSYYTLIQANSLMSSNYSLTLPAALPSGQAALIVDNTGAMSFQGIGGAVEHGWELNGAYAALTYPQNNIDSVFFASYAITIQSVFIYSSTNGNTGITEFDLKFKNSPSGAWTSVFSTTGKIAANSTIAIGALVTTGIGPYTATCTLNNHGFVIGDSVTIAGITPSGYNGTFTVTGATTNTFTFTVGSALGSNTTTGTLATRTLVYTDSGSIVGAQAGVTKPVLSTTSIPAGAIIRWDLLSSMSAGATDARIRMYYTKS